MGPLEGIKVLDFSQALAGPCCTSILADYGAEVIKVENIKGSEMTRHVNLSKKYEAAPEIGGDSFWAICRNKYSISVDTRSPEGMEVVYRLLENADILVSNYRPGTTKAMGIDYETLKDKYPRLICAEIGAFAEKERQAEPAFDAIIQAASGIMDSTGEPASPSKVGFSITDVVSGLFMVQGVMFALYNREKTGRGQNVDVRMQDAGMYFFSQEVVDLLGDPSYKDERCGGRSNMACPNGAAKTKDGYIIINPGNPKLWKTFCEEIIDKPEWVDDPVFSSAIGRMENKEVVWKVIEDKFANYTSEELYQKMKAASLPSSPIVTSKDAYKKAKEEGRQIVSTVKHPIYGDIDVAGFVVNLSETPGSVRKGAPYLGEDTVRVLKEMGGYTEEEIKDLENRGVIRTKE